MVLGATPRAIEDTSRLGRHCQDTVCRLRAYALTLAEMGFDLVDADELVKAPTLNITPQSRAALRGALGRAIVSNITGERRASAAGLSLFFPSYTENVGAYGLLPGPFSAKYQQTVSDFARQLQIEELRAPVTAVKLAGELVVGTLPSNTYAEAYAALFIDGRIVSLKPTKIEGDQISVDRNQP